MPKPTHEPAAAPRTPAGGPITSIAAPSCVNWCRRAMRESSPKPRYLTFEPSFVPRAAQTSVAQWITRFGLPDSEQRPGTSKSAGNCFHMAVFISRKPGVDRRPPYSSPAYSTDQPRARGWLRIRATNNPCRWRLFDAMRTARTALSMGRPPAAPGADANQ